MEKYVSGMIMGNMIQKFLTQKGIYTPVNYRSAYQACKMECRRTLSGTGKAVRYRYKESDIKPALDAWYEKVQ